MTRLRGFTLIEILVVLVIIGVVATLAVVRLGPRDDELLKQEAERLALLLEDARVGELAFNPADRSLMGIRHENGYATLVRIPHPHLTPPNFN